MSTDKSWRSWGAHDPYFGVLAKPQFRGELSGEARDEFFASGEDRISRVFALASLEKPDFAPASALDFGCGTGRLLIPLAQRVRRVVGVDVSPGMLAEAQKNTKHLPGVELVQSDDQLSRVRGSFDLIHSVIVFQHIPVDRGLRLVDRLLSILNEGGVAALHFPYFDTASRFRSSVRWTANHVPGANRALNTYHRRRLDDPPMQMNCYQPEHLFRRATGPLFVDLEEEYGYGFATYYFFR